MLDDMSEGLHFTGERVIPGQVDSNLMLEHLARYRFANCVAADRRILDAACGVGYGSFLLSQSAESVCGLDISEEAIAYARREYRADNLNFIIGDCHSTDLPDSAFDMVVAFEVIEHLREPDKFLVEMRRLLTAQGILILSTPNRPVSEELRSEPNPFHFKEFDPEELNSLLLGYFRHVQLASQNHSEGMAIHFPGRSATSDRRLDFENDAATATLDKGQYLIAVCSNHSRRLQWPNPFFLASSLGNVLRERDRHLEIFSQEVQALKSRLADVEAVLQDRDSHLNIAQQEIISRDGRLRDLENTLAQRDSHLLMAQQEIDGFRHRVSELENTLAERDSHLKIALSDLQQRQERIDTLESELEVKAHHIALLQKELETQEGRCRELQCTLEVKLAESQKRVDILERFESSVLFRLLSRLPYFKNYLKRMRHPEATKTP